MDKKEFVVSWIRRFATIHGLLMMAVFVVGSRVRPDAAFGFSFLGKLMLFSFAGTLPGLVYLSKHELTEREWWVRTLIQYILLNVLLLPLGHMIGLWQDAPGMLIVMGVILIIDVVVHIFSFGFAWLAAADINRMIRQRQGK